MATNQSYMIASADRAHANRPQVMSQNDSRFEKDDKWKMRNKTQLASIKVQLNEKYTEINVMKS